MPGDCTLTVPGEPVQLYVHESAIICAFPPSVPVILVAWCKSLERLGTEYGPDRCHCLLKGLFRFPILASVPMSALLHLLVQELSCLLVGMLQVTLIPERNKAYDQLYISHPLVRVAEL